MGEFEPSRLPPVDRAEVRRLGSRLAVALAGGGAEALAALFRALPPGR